GQTSGFVADVEQWRQLLRVDENSLTISLSKEIRCVLLLSTIRSLCANVSPGLLQLLVRFGLWRPDQAMAYLYQGGLRARTVQTSEALISLAPRLSPDLLQQAFETAQAIRNDWYRFVALSSLAPRLPDSQRFQALQQALETAQAIRNEEDRTQALS